MRQFFIVILSCLLCTACASLTDSKKLQTLAETTLFYEKAIRWGDFAAASLFQHKQSGERSPLTGSGHIKVTSYREISSQRRGDGNEILITVLIDYYHNDAMKVITLKDDQVWKYDPERSAWQITTPLPAFR